MTKASFKKSRKSSPQNDAIPALKMASSLQLLPTLPLHHLAAPQHRSHPSSLSQGILTRFWKLPLLVGTVSVCCGLLASISPTKVVAGELEFSSGSYPSPLNGPTTANQAANLLENTTGSTFVPYTPAITITATISNQQYANGIVFGATVNSSAKAPVAQPVFNAMSAIGTPTNGMFTSNPNGTPGTGISVTDNYAFSLFTTVEPLYSRNLATNGRYYYGDITLTFSRPITNPVIQMTGMGGSSTTSSGVHGHTTEFELVTPGITPSKLSGSIFLNVTGNQILNNATVITASCSTGAACGSVKFAGTNITSLTFRVYVRGDSQPGTWSNPTVYAGDLFLFGGVSIAKPVTVSGTVFNDANGLTDSAINGTGTNAGGLFANLVDSSGNVVASTPVNTNGTYSFLAIEAGQYTVSLSTTAGVQGQTAPASSLPANWVNTGEGTTASGDGTANGSTAITVGSTDLTGVNFGIERPPTAVGSTGSSQSNPGGTNTVTVPATLFTGSTDPDGTVASYKITAFPTNTTSITINGTTYTSANFPAGGVTVPVAQLNTVQLDPIDGAVTASISFQAVDNAGQVSANTATSNLPFTPTVVTLSGTVFADPDGSKVQGTGETGTNAGGLNAVLVDSNNLVVATVPVGSTGTYNFSNVLANANYTVLITTATATVGSAPPAITLPSGWVSTGENLSGTPDATVDSKLSVTVATTNITNANFGIERPPTAVGSTASSQSNPGGTNTVTVPATLFTGSTDPDGTIASYKITAFPTNTTSITIGTTTYTAANFPAGGVTFPVAQLSTIRLDPVDGAVTASISFQAVDNAGQVSANTATSNLPFIPGSITVSGTVWNDFDSSIAINGSEVGTDAGGLYVYAVNASGQVVAKATVNANGTYSLSVAPNTNYTLRLSTNGTVAVGQPAPSASLPTNWVNTGENKNGTTETVTPGVIAVNVGVVDIISQNFGIRRSNTNVSSAVCSSLSEIMFVLDDSSSVDATEVQQQRDSVLAMLDYFINNNIPARAAIVGFDSQRRTVIGYTDVTAANRPLFVNALNTNYGVPGSGTQWELGFQQAASLGISSGNPDLLFFFTDGTNTGGAADDEAHLFRNADTHIYGVGIGVAIGSFRSITDGNSTEAFNTTNATTADYVSVTNYGVLASRMTELLQNLCPPKTPKLILLKRITAINGNTDRNPNDNTPLNQFEDGSGTDDNNPNWPDPNIYLRGAIQGGFVKPEDEVEYTIYFLNTEGSARNVKICDIVPNGQVFVPDAYNSVVPRPLESGSLGTDTGMAIGFSSTSLPTAPTFYLTNAQDTLTGDRGRFFPPGDPQTPNTCKAGASQGPSANTTGAVVVTIVEGTNFIPPANSAGSPPNSYGFIRFRAKLKP